MSPLLQLTTEKLQAAESLVERLSQSSHGNYAVQISELLLKDQMARKPRLYGPQS